MSITVVKRSDYATPPLDSLFDSFSLAESSSVSINPVVTDSSTFADTAGLITRASSRADSLTQSESSSLDTGSSGDSFVLNETRPVLVNPDSPTSTDNVGAAWGYTGTLYLESGSTMAVPASLTTVSGDYTIPAGTTVTNKLFTGYVTFGSSTSKAVNCKFEGRAPGGTFRSGLIWGGSGGQLERCTIRGTQDSATYYMNGLDTTAGDWIATRCSISRVIDAAHANGAGGVKLNGCQLGPFAFFDTDANHTTDAAHPWWTHNDAIQRLSTLSNTDELNGCDIICFFDMTDVTYDGTQYVNGANTIGNPAAAMNGNGKDTAGNYLGNGSTTAYPDGNYCNGITYSNVAPFTGMKFVKNWIHGGSYPSGLIQMTTSGAHAFEMSGNRFGCDGMPGGASNKIFLATYATSSTITINSPNVFDTTLDVPTPLRGQPVTMTSGGTSVIPGDFWPTQFAQPLITFTFDDGYGTQYSKSRPWLNAYGFPATYFIITQYLPSTGSIISATQMATLEAEGNEIGSHTVTHASLATVTSTQLTNELVNSQNTLQGYLGHPVKNFAAPNGSSNAATVAEIRKYYDTQRLTTDGYNTVSNFNRYGLLKYSTNYLSTTTNMRSRVDHAIANKEWLIILTHDIQPTTSSGTSTTVTEAVMQDLIDYVASKGSAITVVTTQQALDIIKPQIRPSTYAS